MTPNQAMALVTSLDAVWPKLDPQSRTFRQAFTDALARATAQNWTAGDAVAYADAKAYAVGTQLYVEVLTSRTSDPYSDRWASALTRTNRLLAEKTGFKGQTADEIKSGASSQAMAEWGPILIILGIALLAAALVAWWIYRATDLVDNELARNALERELVRVQAAAEKILGDHFAREAAGGGGLIPWSEGELSYLTALEEAQAAIINALGPKSSVWSTPWPYVGIGAAALVVLGVVYRDEIKHFVSGGKSGGTLSNPAKLRGGRRKSLTRRPSKKYVAKYVVDYTSKTPGYHEGKKYFEYVTATSPAAAVNKVQRMHKWARAVAVRRRPETLSHYVD